MGRPTRHLLAAAAALALLAPAGAVQAGTGPAGAAVTLTGAAAPRDDDVLTVGETLLPGDALVSPDGRWRLAVAADGAFFVERGTWLRPEDRTLRVADPSVLRYTLQEDGNLVVIYQDRAPEGYGSDGTGTTSVRLGDDGALSFADAGGTVVERVPRVTDTRYYGTPPGALARGDVLLPGEVASDDAGDSRLVMQTDGNLVLYRAGVALWSSGTWGNPGAGLVFQEDDNVVVYSSEGTGRRPLFSTRTDDAQSGGVQSRGGRTQPSLLQASLVVRSGSVEVQRLIGVCCRTEGRPTVIDFLVETAWASDWSSDRVAPGDALRIGDRRTSPDGSCTLVMQGDRNLVQYCDGAAVWASGVPRVLTDDVWFDVRADMQQDGNLVVYQLGTPRDGERPGWNTGTRTPGSTLVLQDDRNVVLYAPGGRPTWSTRTGRL
ncbi:hypothetical protein [Aquipuribacter hungaricus]|uniref:Bulb-type lectin domain-containing protein n=1 Tax=Aquipuribacter hungaricus TaxID=545624 RepID=A0ABV7WKS3_9MICO